MVFVFGGSLGAAAPPQSQMKSVSTTFGTKKLRLLVAERICASSSSSSSASSPSPASVRFHLILPLYATQLNLLEAACLVLTYILAHSRFDEYHKFEAEAYVWAISTVLADAVITCALVYILVSPTDAREERKKEFMGCTEAQEDGLPLDGRCR